LIDDAQQSAKVLELVHPYEDPRVMAGQGTIALEFLEQLNCTIPGLNTPFLHHTLPLPSLERSKTDPLHAVIVPLGGGGMLSGIAVAMKHFAPNCLIIAAEPINANDGYRSFRAAQALKSGQDLSEDLGEVLFDGVRRGFLPGQPNTIADGLRTIVGANPFSIINEHVDVIVQVSEAAILEATKLCFERAKLVIEPSAGVGLAVAMGLDGQATIADILKQRFPREAVLNVGVILCGGNANMSTLFS
jgi:threonine dehydratase